jgi:hypothetical protein
VYARDGFLLFQKGGRTPPELQGLGPQGPGIPDGLEDSIRLPAGEGVEIVSLKFKPPLADLPRANTSMHIHWKCLKPIATDRGLTITLAGKSSEGTRTFRRTFHPCLGLFPTSLWKPGMIIADRYDFHLPFDPDEGTMIGFDWKDWLPEKENGPTSGGMSRRDSSPVAID